MVVNSHGFYTNSLKLSVAKPTEIEYCVTTSFLLTVKGIIDKELYDQKQLSDYPTFDCGLTFADYHFWNI